VIFFGDAGEPAANADHAAVFTADETADET
jgi:hypothetical protein